MKDLAAIAIVEKSEIREIMAQLQLADTLQLPIDALTQTFAILAKRGSGKTYTALVLVEELLKQGLPVVVVDPVGVCWGLRTSADGDAPGLPIAILGGSHGDCAITPDSGSAIAQFIADHNCSMVLDLSEFSGAEMTKFVTDFGETLYQKNRSPLHLVLDEADAFAPQKPLPGEQRMLGAIDKLVRRGRARGLGITLISQRPAVIHKNVLTQIEVLIALRIVSPTDRKAIEGWIEVHGTPEQQKELMGSLASLPIGTAWFWSPGWLDTFEKVQIRPRETFDSSATPKIGEFRQLPGKLAPVDLSLLEQQLAAFDLEPAPTIDPNPKLKQRIAELEKELVQVKAQKPDKPSEINARLDTLIAHLEWIGNEIAETVMRCKPQAEPKPKTLSKPSTQTKVKPRQSKSQSKSAKSSPQPVKPRSLGLRKGERRILETLAACYPVRLTRIQLGTLSQYAPTGGTFGTYLSTLKTQGLIDLDKTIGITQAGYEQALGQVGVRPRSQSLSSRIAMWKAVLRLGERKILEELLKAYPQGRSRENLAKLTGYEPSGGTFGTYLSTLTRNGLIEKKGKLFLVSSLLTTDRVSR